MVDNVLVDPLIKGGDLSQLEKDLSQAVQTRKTSTAGKQKVQQQSQQSQSSDDGEDANLPPKLRGKTKEQIAEMYANLESAHGRMANDLGTQRKLTDRLLDLKRDTDLQNNSPQKVEIKSSDLLENPTEALERFAQSREVSQQQRMAEMEARLAAQQFVQQHPDYRDYENNAEFKSWVESSPIRLRAAAAASQDWSIAADLLTEYKATRKSGGQDDDIEVAIDPEDAEQQARAAAQKASLEPASQGTQGTGKKGGKTYRRADLMRLKAERRDVWENEDFQREILLAYAEGRVK